MSPNLAGPRHRRGDGSDRRQEPHGEAAGIAPAGIIRRPAVRRWALFPCQAFDRRRIGEYTYHMKTTRLGELLKRLREAKGWTLRDAAEAVGVSHAAIRNLEGGAEPKRTTARKLAVAYGVAQSRIEILIP